MNREWIDHYEGHWIDGAGREIHIRVRDSSTAYATLLFNDKPVLRPWCKNKPSINMISHYRHGSGPQLSVELGCEGYTMELSYDPQYALLPDSPEALSVGLSMYESDNVAEKCFALFYPLKPYRRKLRQVATHNFLCSVD